MRQALLGELDNLRERIQDDPPYMYDRAAALVAAVSPRKFFHAQYVDLVAG